MNKAERDLAEIKAIMNRSNRFLSLSGLSGVCAGCFAILGALLAYYWLYYPNTPIGYRQVFVDDQAILIRLMLTAVIVLVLSLGCGFFLTIRKTKQSGHIFWNSTSKRFLINLLIPLGAGGILILALLLRGQYMIVAPSCLIFYGLALVNGSHYTLGDIRYLGLLQISLGLISAFLPGYGLIFWTLGFGILHIVYGISMYIKYDR